MRSPGRTACRSRRPMEEPWSPPARTGAASRDRVREPEPGTVGPAAPWVAGGFRSAARVLGAGALRAAATDDLIAPPSLPLLGGQYDIATGCRQYRPHSQPAEAAERPPSRGT